VAGEAGIARRKTRGGNAVNEESENILAVLQRLERIEGLLERMDRESRSEEARKAAFDVKRGQLMKEHGKIQEDIKAIQKRLIMLEYEPARKKALLWETYLKVRSIIIGVIIVIVTIFGMTSITKLFDIIKLLGGGR
jgi:hypothetical protein